MKKEKLTEYNVTFVGVTWNQAQAIQGAIQSIKEMNMRDELPIKKYQEEINKFSFDLNLFKKAIVYLKGTLKVDVQNRIDYYEKEIAEREEKIKGHQSNIDFVNEYIEKLQSFITEKIDHEKRTVTYTYDMTYLEAFLDLAYILFEVSFDDNVEQTPKRKAS
jgi:chromosome segregation ATPase